MYSTAFSKAFLQGFVRGNYLPNTIRMGMRMTFFLLFCCAMHVGAAGLGQQVTLHKDNAPVEEIFREIRKQTGFDFLMKDVVLQNARRVSINVTNASVKEVMELCMKGQGFTYQLTGNSIIIKKSKDHWLYIVPAAAPPKWIVARGRVVNEAGQPLAGASVKVKNENRGVQTGSDGLFVIAGPESGFRVVVSFLGYEAREVVLNESTGKDVVVVLKATSSELDDVQILAYGKTTKRLNTGNVVTVSAEQIGKNPVPNVLQALQQNVPGMFIQQQTGLPGGRFNVDIRGLSTFGNSSPLYVVDGVVYPGGVSLDYIMPATTTNGDSKGLQGGNALNFIDPSMIESISILKDADATSIYGSRGAYGVVLITTRRGKAGAPILNVNVNQSVSKPGSTPQLLNTQQYIAMRKEAFKNNNATPGATDFDVNGVWDTTRYTDWLHEFGGLYAPALTSNISYSGGSENTTYMLRGNFNRQKNTQKDNGSYRNMGVGFDITTYTPNRKLSLDLSGSFSSTINNAISWDFALGGLRTYAPNAPSLFLSDGSLSWETGDNMAKGLTILYKNVNNNLIANLTAIYKPVKGLEIHLKGGYNLLTGNELRGQPTTYYNPTGAPAPAAASTSTRKWLSQSTYDFEPNIRYNSKLGSKGTYTVTAGATLQTLQYEMNSVTGTGFISDAMLVNPTFATTVVADFNKYPLKYMGYFGQFNYNHAGKYILNLGGRYDGSTKFGEGNRFGTFGSVGAAWLISEEKWFAHALPFISFAKLRGSIGTAGGDGIANYLYLNRFLRSSYTYQGNVAVYPATIANPNLHWEHSTKRELALELAFLKNRILFTNSFYRNTTGDQLITQPLSVLAGYNYYTVNSPALIENKGWEMVLNTKNVESKHFTWSTNINLTVPRNKLVFYPNMDKFAINNNYVLGKSINGIKLYNYAGVSPETGNYTFIKSGVKGEYLTLDANKDNTEFVDLTPKFYGGITNNFSWKQFSFGFMIGVTSRNGKNYMGQQTFPPGIFSNTNGAALLLNRWQKPGDITNIPKVSTGISSYYYQNLFNNSTGAYENATYARLNNVNISYLLPQTALKKIRVKSVRISLQGQNLLTVSKYKNLDPENLGAGSAPLRVYSAAINVSL